MARFYFTTSDRKIWVDPNGTELPDVAAAKREAIRFMGDWLQDQPDEFSSEQRQKLTVTNELGMVMWVITAELVNGPGDVTSERA